MKRINTQLTCEKGASNWLIVLPISKKKLQPEKMRSLVTNNIRMRINQTPLTCACGAIFNLTHAPYCAKGGKSHIGHNENRDPFANFISEVCHEVEGVPKI